jgi:hypothetical protein
MPIHEGEVRMATANQTRLALRPVVEVADEVIFKDEVAVHRHFVLKVQETGTLLQQDIQTALSSHQSKVAMRGALMLGGVAITVWFLWTIAVPVFVALLTAGGLLAAGLWAKFRLPVLMAKMRYKAEYQLREMRNNQRIALRQQELDHVTKLLKQAEANPIQTRLLKAAEDEKMISLTSDLWKTRYACQQLRSDLELVRLHRWSRQHQVPPPQTYSHEGHRLSG